jgi:hypothetical protein
MIICSFLLIAFWDGVQETQRQWRTHQNIWRCSIASKIVRSSWTRLHWSQTRRAKDLNNIHAVRLISIESEIICNWLKLGWWLLRSPALLDSFSPQKKFSNILTPFSGELSRSCVRGDLPFHSIAWRPLRLSLLRLLRQSICLMSLGLTESTQVLDKNHFCSWWFWIRPFLCVLDLSQPSHREELSWMFSYTTSIGDNMSLP